MEWDWNGSTEDEVSSGKLILYFAAGQVEGDLPSFKAAFELSQAIDLEIRTARIDEVKSAYRRIGEVLVPNK